MTNKELEAKVADLERRIAAMEQRPVYVPYPAPQPNITRPVGPCPPVWFQPPFVSTAKESSVKCGEPTLVSRAWGDHRFGGVSK